MIYDRKLFTSLIVLVDEAEESVLVLVSQAVQQVAPHDDGLIEGLHEVLLLINQDLRLRLLELAEDLQLAICRLLLGHVLPLLHAVCYVAEVEAVYSVADETVQHDAFNVGVAEVAA